MKERKQIVRQIDRSLHSIIGEEIPILKKIKRFVIKSGGKRIRPIFHYYIAKVLGYDKKEWQDVAAIGELIHTASLLHDDVLDEAVFRRSQHSLNFLYGNKTSVLSGDYLLACGLQRLNLLETSAKLLPLFTRSVHMLAMGELLQMEQEKSFQISEKKYEKIIWAKTAVLFGCMSESAYVLAHKEKANHKTQYLYRQFGERLGRLFQIRDDFLDYFQSRDASGKEPYQDLKRGLVTRPIIVLYERAGKGARCSLVEILSNPKKRQNKKSREVLENLFAQFGVRQKLEQEIEEEVHRLMSFLRKHPPSPYRDVLLDYLLKLFVNEVK